MATFFDLTSLRGKITSAYLTLVGGILILALIAFMDLLFLGRQIAEGEVISDLNSAVLEMRREEKNLFLYTSEEALRLVDDYAATSLQLVKQYQSTLTGFMGRSQVLRMTRNLEAYRDTLGDWSVHQDEARRLACETQIRGLGHQIHQTVESVSRKERSTLASAVKASQGYLLVSLLIIGLAILVVGRLLKRVVLTPLQCLEVCLQPIAEGRFNRLRPPSNDREFMTFTEAFNRMLKELEIHQRRMLQSEKLASLGILSAGVAHELNNPLSNISSSCQLLMEELTEADPQQLNKWLKQIDNETERGRNIVKTLLEFGSQRVFHKTPWRLLDIVNELDAMVGKTLQHYSAKLTCNIPDDLVWELDKQRMQQLFLNLIQNALHAAGSHVHVRISAMECEPGVPMIPVDAQVAGELKSISEAQGKLIEILVVDDGPGIALEKLSNVFDPFYTTKEPGQGVGLGLFIVQEIVREHDGCVAITTRPGQGTQVIILLPGQASGSACLVNDAS
jgi:signal transduction histidine kinase